MSLKRVLSNVITGASAFPAMTLLLIGNTVSEPEDVKSNNCVSKRAVEAQFYVPRS